MKPRIHNLKERGIAVIMTALTLVFLIPIVGLGIDAGLLYLAKAKLTSACDAGALAAARSLNRGLTLADQEANATNRALSFFDANYPPGFLQSSSRTRNVTVSETAYRLRTVIVTATSVQPVYFMRLLGYNTVTIGATGRANRRDVNLMMVLDRSGSMANSNSCEPMKTAAREFLTYFANGRDRLGLITFSSSYSMGVSPTMTFFTTMDTAIAGISCTGGTTTSAAVSEAYNQIVNINEAGVLNMIVLFTDGLANGLYASFPVKTQTDTRFGNGESSYSSLSTLYSMPPGGCRDSSNRQFPNAAWAPANKEGIMIGGDTSTGNSWGLYRPNSTSESVIADSSGCAMASSGSNRYRRDIAYIPDYDYYGNNARCCYVTPATFTAGPYTNSIRPDRPISVQNAAMNAADSLAGRSRDNLTLKPVIYTLGLGTGVDATLLRRMANDPASPIYDSTKQIGLYAYAPNAADLSRAFAQIASEILRLTR
jgi:Flp pilus assembly protein TadG